MQLLSDIEQVLPSGTIEAATRRAEDMAQQTGEFLRNVGLANPSDEPLVLSGEFLLELAAILQRADWEESGVAKSIGEKMPPALDDLRQLLDRLIQRPGSCRVGDEGIENARLSQQTLRLSLERCAWAGPEMMGADVALGDLEDDELVERLANLLWEHRHHFRAKAQGETR